MTQLPLADRRQRLRNRWAHSKAADNLSIPQFAKFLADLDKAHTHEQIDALSKAWRKAVRPRLLAVDATEQSG